MQCEQPAKRARVGAVPAAAVAELTAKELLLQAASREAAAAAAGQQLPGEADDDDVWRRDAGPEWQAWWQGERVAAPGPSSPPHAAQAADVSTRRQQLPAVAAGGGSGGVVPSGSGVTRRELLRAPAFDAGARDFSLGQPAGRSEATPVGLVALLAADERPRVPADKQGRSAVCRLPRSARQAALDTLANRILAAAASAAGVAWEDFVRSATHTAARREALQRAVSVEGVIAAQSTSALVYRNKAAQRLREPLTPAAAPNATGPKVAVSSRTVGERDAMLAKCTVLRSDTCVAFFEAALAARAHALHLLWEPPYWWRKQQELDALKTAAHDDETDEAAPRDTAEELRETVPVEDAVVQPGQAEQEAKARPEDGNSARVTDAVRSFVRQCVDELAEGVLSAEAASSVVDRATAKVLGRHSQSQSLAFLDREGARIRELCVQYVHKQAAAVVAKLKDSCK